MLSADIVYELDCLQTALEHDQREELGRAVHTLKGLCGHLANREPANEGMICLSFNFSPEEFSLDAVTSKVMEWALQKYNNNKSSAARLLKASRKLFY